MVVKKIWVAHSEHAVGARELSNQDALQRQAAVQNVHTMK